MIVNLDSSEVLVCEILGRLRALTARSAGVKDTKVGKQNGDDSDVMGIKAEYAFAKHFNVFPDLGLTPRSGSADGILQGYSYDIKSTDYANGNLLATRKINPDVDMYVLCIVSKTQVDIKGYVMKEDFISPNNLKDMKHGEGYCLGQSQLTKFKS